jgi:hypothetical protein
MVKRSYAANVLVVSVLTLSGWACADVSCDQAVHELDYSRFLGSHAQCAGRKQDFCSLLANLDADKFERLAAEPKAEHEGRGLRRRNMTLPEAFVACGLDFDMVHYRHCQKAYRQENLEFVSRYCPGEAWSLARAQCERSPETVSIRYRTFCDLFYSGKAPGSGERSSGD